MTSTTTAPPADSRYGVFNDQRTVRIGPWYDSYQKALEAHDRCRVSTVVRSIADPQFADLPAGVHEARIEDVRQAAQRLFSRDRVTWRTYHLRETKLRRARDRALDWGVPERAIQTVISQAQRS